MWSFRCLITLALATFTTCTPIDSANEHARQAAGRHLTIGLATRNNGRLYLRRNILELKNQFPDQWNLFLLATQAFRQIDANDPLSAYQILGIHGRPFAAWQWAMGDPANTKGRWMGYCPHQNGLFATWHRPYVALYEQELSKQVRKIAETATTNRDQWLAAADAFRMPYFDTGLGVQAGELPDFFTNPYVQVTGPDGVHNVISNPLYQYEFQPVIQHDFNNQFLLWNHTMRYPTTTDSNAQTQPAKFRSTWYDWRSRYQDEIGRIFRDTTFKQFAYDLENWHGWFHGHVGGSDNGQYGHFWPSEYSAFEPLFMLHHANVDRMLAIFQAMHPDTWLEPADSGGGNFFTPPSTTVDATWGLQPFWKDDKTFYNSYDVRDTAVFGYAYPETQSWDYATLDDWRRAVTGFVAQTYQTTARAMLTADGAQSEGSLSHVLTDSTFTDWSVGIIAFTDRLPGTFRVEVYLVDNGVVDENTPVVGQWLQQMPMGTNSDWKAQHTKRTTTLEPSRNGTVNLTAGLLENITAGQLANLDADVVVPFLQEHLAFRVTGETGAELEEKYIGAFTLTVVSTTVRIPEDPSEMLEYSDEVMQYPEVDAKYRQTHN